MRNVFEAADARPEQAPEKVQFIFPFDIIEPVPKGEFGGDVLHRVVGKGDQAGGTIFWKFKRIKNWSVLHDAGRSGEGTQSDYETMGEARGANRMHNDSGVY